ncbi:hypothetical protein [Nonomuraea gerenzanensis]|uniref:Lipolytic enzyme, G-D-S-L n=1 Tax=Nonomuraea gerenzanensis TaxID=93944 RepID=A0A1M4EH12_9ACTN|nr:hypothetical protein [Nonomuraea gerenzanensis]UBU09447.1 hypothetical protein LCN96_34425 [Nonomuraea gerenzanensis]SBO97863.1 lipolytic enzyme, G-D-S-L [Nonomuraea gerenzanensis]
MFPGSFARGGASTRGADGGYRTGLWQLFQADGRAVDFLGSQASGPARLGGTAHEGHGGWRVGQLAGGEDTACGNMTSTAQLDAWLRDLPAAPPFSSAAPGPAEMVRNRYSSTLLASAGGERLLEVATEQAGGAERGRCTAVAAAGPADVRATRRARRPTGPGPSSGPATAAPRGSDPRRPLTPGGGSVSARPTDKGDERDHTGEPAEDRAPRH